MIDEILLHLKELRALCRRFHVRRLDLFGSAARGEFVLEWSDVDFLVEFDRGHPEALSLKTHFLFQRGPRSSPRSPSRSPRTGRSAQSLSQSKYRGLAGACL